MNSPDAETQIATGGWKPTSGSTCRVSDQDRLARRREAQFKTIKVYVIGTRKGCQASGQYPCRNLTSPPSRTSCGAYGPVRDSSSEEKTWCLNSNHHVDGTRCKRIAPLPEGR